MTPLSHSFDAWSGMKENFAGMGSFKLGLNAEGGEVFNVNLYNAKWAATAIGKEFSKITNNVRSTSTYQQHEGPQMHQWRRLSRPQDPSGP